MCLLALFTSVSFVFDRAAAHVGAGRSTSGITVCWAVAFPLIAVALAVVALPPL